jgi:5-formyltetrahydrofolate cyclo-ligase
MTKAPTKQEQRKKIADLIQKIDPQARAEKSKSIAERIFALRAYKDARSVMCYVALNDEADTALILDTALKDGKAVSVPVVSGDTMYAVSISPKTEFTTRKFGIKEPVWGVVTDFADLIIVPVRAFDGNCMRLGRGCGYYDKYLSERPLSRKIGLAFEEQFIKNLAADEHDEELDAVVTDIRTIGCPNEANEKTESGPDRPKSNFIKRLYDKLTDK